MVDLPSDDRPGRGSTIAFKNFAFKNFAFKNLFLEIGIRSYP